MSLPQISTLNTTQDANKQLAQIRSYLIQLKDEVEQELNNITYEQLSASLQKKIDAINEDIARANNFTDIVAQTLKAQYIKADSISATYATVSSLSAQAARIDNLVADHVSVGDLSATNASIEKLRTDVVEANYVTTSVLQADELIINQNIQTVGASVEQLRASIVEADYVTTTALNAKHFTADHVTAGTINGNYVAWQKIYCVGSGEFGYLYKNSSTKDIIFSTDPEYDKKNPSYARLCEFLKAVNTKAFYTLAKDNA